MRYKYILLLLLIIMLVGMVIQGCALLKDVQDSYADCIQDDSCVDKIQAMKGVIETVDNKVFKIPELLTLVLGYTVTGLGGIFLGTKIRKDKKV